MEFSEHGKKLVLELRTFLKDQVEPQLPQWDAERSFPAKAVLQALAAGVPALNRAIREGGSARLEAALALEQAMAPAVALDIATALSMQLNIVAPLLADHGSAALRRECLARIHGGEMLVSWSMPDNPSDRSLPQAVVDGDRLVVTGTASQVVNASGADAHAQVVRIVQPGAGAVTALLLIPAQAKGVEVTPRTLMGFRSAALSDVRYTGVAAAADRIIGERGTGAALAARQRQFFWALSALRMAATSMEMVSRTRAWCKERKTFGMPLLANQSVQFRLADAFASTSLTLELARAAVQDAPRAGSPALLPEKAKYAANQLVAEIAEMATHLHGSHGYIEGGLLTRFYRDAAVAQKSLGANDTLLQRVFDFEMVKPQDRHD